MKLADLRGVDTDVYGPAEDSALLATAVEQDLETSERVLDVGTGSGYVGQRIAEATGARVVGTDINPDACRRAREHGIETVRCDLTSPFRANTFDTVLFNPPYLPAVEEVELDPWFEIAVTGGASGRAVIDRFLSDVSRVLIPEGRAYLLVSSLTGIDPIKSTASDQGLIAQEIASVEYPDEVLVVLKFQGAKSL